MIWFSICFLKSCHHCTETPKNKNPACPEQSKLRGTEESDSQGLAVSWCTRALCERLLQAELGRCPAASAAFALLSKGTQEANQVHLVFTDSLSTHTDRISALSSLRCLAAAPPRHFHQQKKQHWRKQVSFCQESALSWLIEKSNPSFKSTGKKKLFLFVLSGNTTELMLWLQPSFAVPNFGEANEAHKRATQNCSTSASINNVYSSAQISGIRKKNYKDLIMAMQQPSSTNSTWSVLLPPILITCSRN